MPSCGYLWLDFYQYLRWASKKEGGCRSEVRQSEGVKIYFDPVSTAAREESARDLAAKVLADLARKDSINTVLSPPQINS